MSDDLYPGTFTDEELARMDLSSFERPHTKADLSQDFWEGDELFDELTPRTLARLDAPTDRAANAASDEAPGCVPAAADPTLTGKPEEWPVGAGWKLTSQEDRLLGPLPTPPDPLISVGDYPPFFVPSSSPFQPEVLAYSQTPPRGAPPVVDWSPTPSPVNAVPSGSPAAGEQQDHEAQDRPRETRRSGDHTGSAGARSRRSAATARARGSRPADATGGRRSGLRARRRRRGIVNPFVDVEAEESGTASSDEGGGEGEEDGDEDGAGMGGFIVSDSAPPSSIESIAQRAIYLRGLNGSQIVRFTTEAGTSRAYTMTRTGERAPSSDGYTDFSPGEYVPDSFLQRDSSDVADVTQSRNADGAASSPDDANMVEGEDDEAEEARA